MKKKYLIIAIITFSFFVKVANIQAQDTTLNLWSYLTKTSWLIGIGPDIVDNNNDNNPFKINNHGGPDHGGSPRFNTPFRVSVEKNIYEFRHWKITKGFSVMGVVSSTSLRPHNFGSVDLYLKYSLKTLIDTKWFDPYLLGGLGYTYMDFSTGDHDPGFYNAKRGKLDMLNLNAGLGFNIWIFPNLAINLQSVGKKEIFNTDHGKFEINDHTHGSATTATNYFQNSIGLIFKIGRCSTTAIVNGAQVPCTRSKEAEDALIHLREHINK